MEQIRKGVMLLSIDENAAISLKINRIEKYKKYLQHYVDESLAWFRTYNTAAIFHEDETLASMAQSIYIIYERHQRHMEIVQERIDQLQAEMTIAIE